MEATISSQWPISTYDQLTPGQRLCADDIVTALMATVKTAQPSKETITKVLPEHSILTLKTHQISQTLWHLAFNPSANTTWNTSLPIPIPFLPPPLKHKDLRTFAGVFSQDLPPSKCAKRHMNSNYKTAPARRKGQVAYVQARLSPDSTAVEWFWSDEAGKGVHEKYIEEHPYGQQIKEHALQKHDGLTFWRASVYNEEYVAFWMRCRLARVTAHLQPADCRLQRVGNPTSADFAALLKHESLLKVYFKFSLAVERLQPLGTGEGLTVDEPEDVGVD